MKINSFVAAKKRDATLFSCYCQSVLSALCYEVIERPCRQIILLKTGVIKTARRRPAFLCLVEALRGRDLNGRDQPNGEEA